MVVSHNKFEIDLYEKSIWVAKWNRENNTITLKWKKKIKSKDNRFFVQAEKKFQPKPKCFF